MATEDFNPLDFSAEYPVAAAPEVNLNQFMPAQQAPQESPARGLNHTNLRLAYDYFLNKGLSPHHAAAIAGNIAQESGGHTRAMGDANLPGGSFGMAQWNRERLAGLNHFAEATGTNPSNPQTQLEYMWYELNNTERPALQRLLATNNLEDATRAFGAGYERPNEQAANYNNRINYARNILGGAQANSALRGEAAATGPLRTVPIFDHDAQRPREIAIPENAPLNEVMAALQQSGRNVEPLQSHALTNGKTLHLPESADVNKVLASLKAQQPDLEWMTQEHAAKTGFGAAVSHALKSLGPQLQRGAGEIGQEFGVGEDLIAGAKAKQAELDKQLEETLPTDPAYKRYGQVAGELVGGALPLIPAAGLAVASPVVGAGLVGLSTLPLAAGSLAQRYDQKGEDMSLREPGNLAAVAGEAALQMAPGVSALRPVAGQMLKSGLKGAAATAIPDIASVGLERAAAGQELLSPEALQEYAYTGAGDLIGGGGMGAYMGRKGAAPTPGAEPKTKAEVKPGERAEVAGEDQTLEDLLAQVQQEPLPEAAPTPPEQGQLPPPPEQAAPEAPMPSPEAPPQGPIEPEIPEPELRQPPARHELAEILDLKPSKDPRSLYHKLGQLDIRQNPEDVDRLIEHMDKTRLSFTPEQHQNLNALIDEVRRAHGIQETAEPDVGGSPQPGVFQEGEGAPVGGEGIPQGGQESGPPKGGREGQEPPEKIAPVEMPELAPGEQGRKEFAERVGAKYEPEKYLETPHNDALGEHVQNGNFQGALDELSKSDNPFHRHVAEHARRLKDVTLGVNKRLGVYGRHTLRFNPGPGETKHTFHFRPDRVANMDTVAHEFLHGLSVEAIDLPTKEQLPHVNALINLHKQVKANPALRGKNGRLYGAKNVYEFVAEGLSNPEFQHRLNSIELTKNVTAWDRFTQLIGRLIGIKKSTALTELTTHANRLFEATHGAAEAPIQHARKAETLIHEKMDDEDAAHADTAEKHRGSWWDKLQDALHTDKAELYTKLREKYVSHQAALENILGKQEMYGPTGEIRAKAKLNASVQAGNLIGEAYRRGYIKRNEQGLNEVVHDPELALEKWREDFSALPDDLREKFAEAIDTLAKHGHNTRYAEHMEVFNKAKEELDLAKARVAANKSKLNRLLSKQIGTVDDFAPLIRENERLEKGIKTRERLVASIKDRYKNKRAESGKIFDVNEADAKAARELINSTSETKDLDARMRKNLRLDAEMLRDNNVISDATLKTFTDPKYAYAPRYMQLEDLDKIIPEAGLYPRGISQRRVATPKELRGGQHEINLLENLFQHRAKMGAMAIHNNAKLGSIKELERMGLAKQLPANTTPQAKIDAVSVMENGKRHYYEVHDRSLYDAFEILHHAPIPYLTKGTKTLSHLMLVNPGYWFNQLAREPFMASVTTGLGLKDSWTSPVDTLGTFASLILNKTGNAHVIYDQLKAQGVTGRHDYLKDMIRDTYKDVIKPPKTALEKAEFHRKNTWEVLQRVHEYADAAAKVSTMKRLIEQAKRGEMTGTKMSEDEARNAAISKIRDMLNLQARGRSEAINYFNNTTPFFNTYLQGMDAIIRNATGYGMTKHEAEMARRSMVAHASALVAFSTAAALANALGSEAYRNATQEELLNNWVLPIGDGKHLIKAKAPFEFTVLKAIPELIVRNALGLDTMEQSKHGLAQNVMRNLAPPGIESFGIPFLVKPIAEAMLNQDLNYANFIAGRAGHPIGTPTIAPEQRGRGKSDYADAISDIAGVAGLKLSPAAISHVARSYLPGLASALDSTSAMTTALIGAATGKPSGKTVTRDMTEIVPFLHDFMTNPNKVDAASRDYAQEQKMLTTTGHYMQRRGIPGAAEYIQKGRESKAAGRVDELVSKLDQQIARIRNTPEFKNAQAAQKAADDYQKLLNRKREVLKKEVTMSAKDTD